MRGGIASLLANNKPESPTVVEERVLNFLRQSPPFQFLDEATLRQVVAQTELQFFPQHTRILPQDDPAADYLYVIERGGVRQSLLTELGAEAMIEVAGEGELFGLLSSLEVEAGRLEVTALADTVCYAVPAAVIEALLETQPAFAHYLLRFSIEHYLDWGLAQARRTVALSDGGDRLLFTGRARDLARRPLVVCPGAATIQEAAQLMNDRRISSVVVLDEAGQAAGIITDWDLRERVIAAGRDIHSPVWEIMKAPLITISGDEPIYEAVRLMIAHNIHHLVVYEGDMPLGMITSHELVVLQGTSTLFIVREIDRQDDLAGLRQVHDRAQHSIPFLLSQGVRAGHLGWLLADINDRLVARVIELIETESGRPPLPYCWLLLGSEGRREQTFKTDQDNALIYADPPAEMADSSRAYFLEFGRRVVAALIEVGFPPCPGQLMADNPRWVQPLSGWADYFRQWLAAWDPAEIVEALPVFDFRGIFGDLTLAERLHDSIAALIAQNQRFLNRLSHLSTRQTPPLGFLGHFVLEQGGEHKDKLDLKRRGTMPVVDLARFFALRHGLSETNTLSRLYQLKAAGHLSADSVDELAQAFEFMLNLRIRHQWEQLQANRPVSNHLNPGQLSALDRRLLRESFKVIAQTQAALKEAYHVRVGRLFS